MTNNQENKKTYKNNWSLLMWDAKNFM